MTGATIAAGALVGISTELKKPGHKHTMPVSTYDILIALDDLVIATFTLEICVKMGALGSKCLDFFADNWNKFDFVVVFLNYVLLTPALLREEYVVSTLRLSRHVDQSNIR